MKTKRTLGSTLPTITLLDTLILSEKIVDEGVTSLTTEEAAYIALASRLEESDINRRSLRIALDTANLFGDLAVELKKVEESENEDVVIANIVNSPEFQEELITEEPEVDVEGLRTSLERSMNRSEEWRAEAFTDYFTIWLRVGFDPIAKREYPAYKKALRAIYKDQGLPFNEKAIHAATIRRLLATPKVNRLLEEAA